MKGLDEYLGNGLAFREFYGWKGNNFVLIETVKQRIERGDGRTKLDVNYSSSFGEIASFLNVNCQGCNGCGV